jgi:hypothetical protein
MTKTAVAAFAATLLLSASGAVSAATESAPATTPAPQAQVSPAAKAANEDKVICKTETPTGSRLGAKKTCMKKSDWDKQAAQAREMMLHRPPSTAGQN